MAALPTPFLNVDAGELESEPPELFALAHAVSIACGGHAGDDASMTLALERAAAAGTRAGAHPSYPDRAGFGRVAMTMSDAALRAALDLQLGRLAELAQRVGLELTHVKPHGALYHAAAADAGLAALCVEAAASALGQVAIVGPPSGALRDAASARGQSYWREGFADRGMRPDGSLIARGEPGALLESAEEALAQTRRLVDSGNYDTLCVHGDTPGAVVIARAVRAALDETPR